MKNLKCAKIYNDFNKPGYLLNLDKNHYPLIENFKTNLINAINNKKEFFVEGYLIYLENENNNQPILILVEAFLETNKYILAVDILTINFELSKELFGNISLTDKIKLIKERFNI